MFFVSDFAADERAFRAGALARALDRRGLLPDQASIDIERTNTRHGPNFMATVKKR